MQNDTAFLTGGSGIFCWERGEGNGLSGHRSGGDRLEYKEPDKEQRNTIAGVGRMLGIADMSTMYKWLRGDALPGIDNMLALSMLLGVSINDILVTK